MNRLALIVCMLMFTFGLYAQDELYNVNIEPDVEQIKWMDQSHLGTIIIGGKSALAGYDQTSGKLKWKRSDIQRPDGDTYSMINENIMYAYGYDEKGDKFFTVLDTDNGKSLWRSSNEIKDIVANDVNAMYIFHKNESKVALTVVDLENKKEAWTKDLFKVGGLLSSDEQFVSYSSDYILIGKKKTVHCYDVRTGDEVWKKDYKYSIQLVHIQNDQKVAVIQSDKYIDLLSMIDGNKLNKSKLRTKSEIAEVIDMEDGKALLICDSGFNILSYQQEKLEFKDLRTAVKPNEVIFLDNDFLAYNRTGVYCYDNQGKKKWTKSLNGEVYGFEIFGNEAIIIMLGEAFKLDLIKGKSVKKSSIRYSSADAILFDPERKLLTKATKKKMETMDFNSLEKKMIGEKYKIKTGGGLSMEKRSGTYFVSADESLAIFDHEGKLIKNHKFKIFEQSVGLAETAIGLKYGSAVASGLLDDGKRTSSRKKRRNQATVLGVNFDTRKVTASYDGFDHYYFFGHEDYNPYLFQISKDNGEIVRKYAFIDKDPTYQINEELGILSIAEEEKFLVGFSTK